MVDFLRDFIHILRSSDLRVSTSESIDAMNVVSEIGIEDRSLLKHSLSFSLAKTLREKEIFNECFDNFFEENYMNLSEDKLPQKNNKKELSKLVAEQLAKKAKDIKITKVYFDRGIYKYHGRVRLLAEELRKHGLEF